jgi:hypothetical protein
MLERNLLQPPRSSAPLQSAGWLDSQAAGCSGLFASPEDYDATGILAGVDPYESRYWWMPELFPTLEESASSIASPSSLGSASTDRAAPETTGLPRRTGLAERLLRTGQATRRTGSRSTAAA